MRGAGDPIHGSPEGRVLPRSRRRLSVMAVGLAFLLTIAPGPRRALGVALFLPDLVPSVTARPLTWVSRTPIRATIAFDASGARSSPPAAGHGDSAPVATGDAPWDGVLFLPAGRGPHPGLVIALGVTPAGRDDPRVISLGDGLARLGVAAFVPYSPNLEGRHVTPEEIEFLVAAHQTLAAQENVDPARVGFFGFCVGASLALLAAGDERIAEEVAVLGWFGGYHRLDRLFASVLSRSALVAGEPAPWVPDPLAREVVEAQLRAIEAEAPAAREAVAGLLAEPGRAEAEALLAALPTEARATMDRLSPATRAANVRAPIYLMSDTGDALIPASETDALASDLGDRVTRRTIFTVFSHVDLDDLEEPARVLRELAALHGQVHAILGALR